MERPCISPRSSGSLHRITPGTKFQLFAIVREFIPPPKQRPNFAACPGERTRVPAFQQSVTLIFCSQDLRSRFAYIRQACAGNLCPHLYCAMKELAFIAHYLVVLLMFAGLLIDRSSSSLGVLTKQSFFEKLLPTLGQCFH